MPVLRNGAIRGSKKQLHKLEDFLGAVLSKEESEGKRHGRKNSPAAPCCQTQLALTGYHQQMQGEPDMLLPH